jgi:hypothetical protein
VQSRINRICQVPVKKTVKFYSEEKNDISLGRKLTELLETQGQKCNTGDCEQYKLYHTHHFYHGKGYVQMKMRLSSGVPQDPSQHHHKKADRILIGATCHECSAEALPYAEVNRQLQELSFYSFLEQFFYNQEELQLLDSDPRVAKQCTHNFHAHCKVVFVVGVLRVEFQYKPVDIYNLDLICFRDQPGALS